MKKDLVSIITPVYNAEKYISDTIESVLSQTYNNFELLLVDDHSTDNSYRILKEYGDKDKRIKLLNTPINSGAAVARNTGIEHAKGRYIAFIDSDDKWYDTKLEKQINFMKERSVGFTYTKFELINGDGRFKKKAASLPEKLSYTDLLKNTAIACSTVVIDRSIIGDFKMPLVRRGQDTATWLRILRNHDYAYLVDETLNKYRAVEGSLSSNKIKALKRTWHTYRKLEMLSLPKALYYFIHYTVNAILRRKK